MNNIDSNEVMIGKMMTQNRNLPNLFLISKNDQMHLGQAVGTFCANY